MNNILCKRNRLLIIISVGLSCLALFFQVNAVFHQKINLQATIFMLIFSVLTVLLLTTSYCKKAERLFIVYFLLSSFTLITTWRISSLVNIKSVDYIYFIVIVLRIISYLIISYTHIKESEDKTNGTHYEWQLAFIRMYIGFDLIPHFVEKIFAGPAARLADINDFSQLHIPNAHFLVMLSGLIELAGSFSIGCGFLTRLGAVCLAIYLLVATTLGGHFANGFIWANPDGGWEFPILWSVIVLSFFIKGSGPFSLDGYLRTRWNLPKILKLAIG